MNRRFLFIASMLITFTVLKAHAISDSRILIDDDWRFTVDADSLFYRADYNDSGWQRVSLPHDWSVLNNFDKNEPSGNDGGYLPTGKGWYRKTINIPASMAGNPCDIYFEGVYMDSEVYCNGHKTGGHPYGYTSFRCDISPYIKAGENIIAVKVDNSKQKNSRWYSGSGIYRHVWLEPHGDIYVKPLSMQVTTPVITTDKGIVRVNFNLANTADSTKETITVPVTVSIKNNKGNAGAISDSIKIQPGETTKYCSYEIPVATPELWSISSPSLYTATVSIERPGKQTESESETFGFRTIEYDAESGFKLNGVTVLISGACLHHDNGILGAASYDDAEIRKARLIKDAGFNAVRTSHNPPAPAFIAACDSIGLMVIDEAFDGWRAAKNAYDYSVLFDEWAEKDMAALVKRDRNSPSVICWSIGNEVIERKSPDAVEIADMLAAVCHRLDPTRPVTSALAAWDRDWEIYDPLASRHDIVGYNYMIHKAESDHRRVPSRVMWQTESFPRDAFKNWEKVTDHPYIIGDFVWTGIDYIGESGIGRYYYDGDPAGEHFNGPLWPWHNSYCGDIDIIGSRKPISHYRELLYTDSPKLHMAVREPDGYNGNIKETLWGVYPTFESWDWNGHEGKPVEVEVISNYPEVELFLNGVSAGRQPTDRKSEFKATYRVNYRPGELKAIAFDKNGNPAETYKLVTAGKPYAIKLISDRDTMPLSPQSLAYITAEVVDKKGNVVTNAALPVKFSVTGCGEVIATGSGNPKDGSGYFNTQRLTDAGKALGIIKLTDDAADGGEIKVKVTSPGLKPATIVIKSINKY